MVMKTLREMMDLIEAAQQGVAEVSKPTKKEYLKKLDQNRKDMEDARKQGTYGAPGSLKNVDWVKKQGVVEGDFDQWGGEIKTPNPDRKQFKQPTSPAKLARQQAADRQRKKSAKEGVAEEQVEESSPDALSKIDKLFRK